MTQTCVRKAAMFKSTRRPRRLAWLVAVFGAVAVLISPITPSAFLVQLWAWSPASPPRVSWRVLPR